MLKNEKRFHLFVIVLLFVVMQVFPSAGAEQEKFPSKSIELVVPWSAGGSTDSYIRILVPKLEKELGVRVVVNNISGGEGVPAAKYFERTPADGYTIYALGPEEIINDLYGRMDFEMFDPVLNCQMDQGLLWVRADDERFKTFNDFVEYVKSNPGKLNMVAGFGIDQVVLGELLSAMNVPLDSVTFTPYNVGREATAQLLGGHADIELEEPSAMLPQVQSSAVRPLVVFATKRIPKFPDCPTAIELGYNLTTSRWRGIATRKGVPQDRVEVLIDAFRNAMDSPEYHSYETNNVLDQVPGFMDAQQYGTFLNDTYLTYKQILSKLGTITD